MKSAIWNSLKTLTLTSALTGVIMSSLAHAAITTASVDNNNFAQQISKGQLYAAVKSDRDGKPDDDQDNDDDGKDDNADGKDDSDDGDDSDGDDSDGDGDSDSDGDD